MKKHICIIGCGTFGAYLLRRLLEKYGDQIAITAIEIGNHKIQNETGIGLDSISEHSKVSKDGRYFGLGGTSARWGGQVLFFDERDNPAGDATWHEIVRINERHKNIVLKKLLGENARFNLSQYEGTIKTGIWLKYAKRNMFNRLNKHSLKQVQILPDQRVVDFSVNAGKITKVTCKSKAGEVREITADYFYLTAGALESCRLLLSLNHQYGLLDGTDIGNNFGDHISTELFHVHQAKPVINGVDFTPQLLNGSLVTRRIIVQSENGTVGFLHTIFNKDVKAFKFLKELMFGKRSTTVSVGELMQGVAFLFNFGFHLLFKQKLYVDNRQWSLQLDMEQPVPNSNKLSLSGEKDQYGEAVLHIDWNISKADMDIISEVRKKVETMLAENNLKYTPLFNPAATNNKVEDVYHPVGCLRVGHDDKAVVNFHGQVKGVENLFHFSTGIFPSAKSINPSAAVMCFIEEHLDKQVWK